MHATARALPFSVDILHWRMRGSPPRLKGEIVAASKGRGGEKSGGNTGSSKSAGGSGQSGGNRGYGPPGGWPSTTGNKSGDNRGNAPPSKS